MIVYVQRSAGVIVGVYALPQPGLAEEAVDDSDPEVVAYYAGPDEATLAAITRAEAKAFLADNRAALLKIDRAIALIAMDEVNLLRDWLTGFAAHVAAAASLADLKLRVATLPNLPQRTKAQLIAAILARIDGGEAD